jgi:CRP/FNR family cyclic AMP-dependent transcriptional regulator
MTNTESAIDEVCTKPIADLARLGSVQSYPPKTMLVRERDAGHSLFVVLDGRIRIFTENQDGRRFVLGAYGPGTLFGEGALDGGPRSASVESISGVTCAVVQYSNLKSHIAAYPAFAMALVTELIARSRSAMTRMKGLALDSVYQRLRALIEAESIEQNGVRTLGPEWSQQEIANRLGSSRDMITKIFRELTKGGYLDAARGAIRVLKPLPKGW